MKKFFDDIITLIGLFILALILGIVVAVIFKNSTYAISVMCAIFIIGFIGFIVKEYRSQFPKNPKSR